MVPIFHGGSRSTAALLVLFPRTAILGLLLLACTMLCASLIVAFLLQQRGEAAFPGLLLETQVPRDQQLASCWSATRKPRGNGSIGVKSP
jgi:hypothetical protein